MSTDPTKLSKFLSLVLRHKPDAIGLTLDPHGWALIDEVIAKAGALGTRFDRADLMHVVATNNKKRFSISEDGQFVRAAQGHSIMVDLGLTAQAPPKVLYHGTATRFLAAILAEGLKPQSRQHVHLSLDEATANNVGRRHGKPAILRVAAGAMHDQSFQFFLADNGVWLTDHVPPAFLTLASDSSNDRGAKAATIAAINVDDLRAATDGGWQPSFLFFWGHRPRKDGRLGKHVLSQWWPAAFTIDGQAYPTAEHFMMAEKARLFGDDETRARILAAADPGAAKALGRQVRGFDATRWDAACVDIVVRGNLAKFGQDAALGAWLTETGDSVLVEASPVDAVWGIGLAADDPRASDPRQWRGRNLLGFALMQVRERLRG